MERSTVAIAKVRRRRTRKKWTTDAVREFKKLARQKHGAVKLAKYFDRTVGALRAKANTLGISLSTR
jgi:hypothetical protein